MVYAVQATVTDSDNKSSSFSFFLDDALDVAAATAAAKSIIEAADPLFDGIVTGVTMALAVDTTGWTLKSATTGENDRLIGGKFVFAGAGNVGRKSLTLPSFENDTYVPPGSENIDQSDPDIAAFLAAFLGTSTTTNQGIELLTTVEAVETFGGKK